MFCCYNSAVPNKCSAHMCAVPSCTAGDHAVIAKETAQSLGLGANIQDAAGLPSLDADGKVPKNLGKQYGAMIMAADGFAQVSKLQ